MTTAAAKAFVNAARAGSGHGVEIEVEGQVAQSANQQGAGGLPFGFLAAGIVLFIVFGSLLAMLLPLLTAGLSLGTAVAVIGLLSHVIQMASFSNELSLLIGLGVGVDYALFIVTRYRQGLLRGLSGEDAIVEALDTSGRAVLFAGMTVCIAMLGMFALGVSFLYGVAIATSIAVAFTVLASLTLLPALLGFFGLRVLRRRERRALKDRQAPHQRRVARVGAVGGLDAAASGAVRRGRHRRARAARDPVLLDATRLGRLRVGPGGLDHAEGVRPARQGLRSGLQRAAPARRPGLGRRSAGRVRSASSARSPPLPASSARRARSSSRAARRGARASRSPTSTPRARRRTPRPPTFCTPSGTRSCPRPSAEPACTCSSADRPRSSTTSRPCFRASCRCSWRS